MSNARLTDNAEAQLEAIYDYTERRWDADQAERYTRDILQACTEIALKHIRSRPIAAELGFDGFVAKRGSHFIHWRIDATETSISLPSFISGWLRSSG